MVTKKSGGNIQNNDLDRDNIEFEDVLEKVGSMGRFQIMVWFLCGLVEMQTAGTNMLFVFSNYKPDWNCTSSSQGETCVNGSICDDYEFTNNVYHSIIIEWNLICGRSYIPNILTSIQFSGLLIGAAVFGQLGDLIGRKKVYLICTIGISVSSILTGVSPNWYAFAVFRFLCGAFVGGNFSVGWMVAAEFVGVRHRPFMFMTAWFVVGIALLSGVAAVTRHWRYTTYVIGGAGIVIVPLIAWFVPESPRWLIQRRYLKEAKVVLNRMSAINGRGHLEQMDEILPKLVRNVEGESESKKYTYLQLVSTGELAVKTVATCTMWFTMSYIYYFISVQMSGFPGNVFTNVAIQNVATNLCLWSSMPIVIRLNRKIVYIALGLLTFSCLVLLIVLRETGLMSATSIGFSVLALLGQTSVSAQWCSTGSTTVEMYPTLLRTMAFGAASVAARIAGILAPQIDTLGTITHWTLPYIIGAILMIVSIVLLQVLLPETAGRPIKEEFRRASKKLDLESHASEDQRMETMPLDSGDTDLQQTDI